MKQTGALAWLKEFRMMVQECSETSDWWKVGSFYTYFSSGANVTFKHTAQNSKSGQWNIKNTK